MRSVTLLARLAARSLLLATSHAAADSPSQAPPRAAPAVGTALTGVLVLGAFNPQADWMALPLVAGIGVLSVTASVLCYRWSSDDEVSAAVVPTQDGRGAQLVVRGVL